ncbi:MAG: hypothetical protein JNK37_11435 [Verrucomicrobiales bacterium]|nr:hypothetical protein [Verrucomicrobiales bacterium]
MTRRHFSPALLALLTAGPHPGATAEEAGPVFVFETGNPPWKGERIPLPPSFAPDLGWKGVEEIRFAPGMFEADAPDFFSYVLVFSLQPGSAIAEADLERELLTYYRGLSAAVMRGRQQTVDTRPFTVALGPQAKAESPPAAAPDVTAYTGTLRWIEPFATQRDQTLHLEIHTWQHRDRPVVLSCVSPIPPDAGALWKSLRDIRARFRFAD